MLPSLSALSLGTPTGAKDDVVKEIMDEREAEKMDWEVWHMEQEMMEREAAEDAARSAAEAKRRREAAEQQPPIYTLPGEQDGPGGPGGPFSIIVDKLVERLTPDAEAMNGSDADAMCRDVANVCRELATLNRLPGQVVDPRYNCSDPNAEIWKYAHAIFGVDPMGKLWLRGKKPNRLSFKQNFVVLCKAFRPDFTFTVVAWEAFHGGGIDYADYLVWNQLWRSIPENLEMAEAWEENDARERARYAFADRSVDSEEESDEDYDEEAAFESFYEGFKEQDYDWARYVPKPEELKRLRAKIRLPIKPGSAQIKWRIDNMQRLRNGCDLYYDLDKPHRFDDDYFKKLKKKTQALERLFKTLLYQARAMQAAASV